jgi:hypothetical protein
MEEAKLPQEEAEQHFSEETTKLKFVAEWQVKTTGDGKDGMGDLDDLPICREEVQPRRLQGQSHPLE